MNRVLSEQIGTFDTPFRDPAPSTIRYYDGENEWESKRNPIEIIEESTDESGYQVLHSVLGYPIQIMQWKYWGREGAVAYHVIHALML